MNDVIVTIRVPKTLAEELKELAKSQHFLDLSEEVRGIIRQKWIAHVNPELFELKKLREDIEHEIQQKSIKKIQKEVVKELEKIKSRLKNEGMLE